MGVDATWVYRQSEVTGQVGLQARCDHRPGEVTRSGRPQNKSSHKREPCKRLKIQRFAGSACRAAWGQEFCIFPIPHQVARAAPMRPLQGRPALNGHSVSFVCHAAWGRNSNLFVVCHRKRLSTYVAPSPNNNSNNNEQRTTAVIILLCDIGV